VLGWGGSSAFRDLAAGEKAVAKGQEGQEACVKDADRGIGDGARR